MDIRSNSSPTDSRASIEARTRHENERRVRQAEREAHDRIADAEENASTAVEEIQEHAVRVRRSAEEEIRLEQERAREQIERVRREGYEQLRDLKRRQTADISQTRDEGEHLQGELQEFYQTELDTVGKVSSKAVREAYMQNLGTFKLMDAQAKNQKERLETNHAIEMRNLRERHEKALRSETEKTEKEQQDLKARNDENFSQAEKRFHERYDKALKTHEAALNRLNEDASRKLGDLREDATRKLATYETRQEDPFYQLVDLDAELTEIDDAFILTARVPEHEQSSVKATVQGNQIVLTGTRRAEDREELGEGRQRSTSSFQSFRETFAVDWPVSHASILRETDGELLTFIFPKRAGMIDPETGQKKSLQNPRLADLSPRRAPRPDFPENLVPPAPSRPNKPIS